MAIRRRIAAAATTLALVVTAFAAGGAATAASTQEGDELPVFTTQGPIIDRFTDETSNPGQRIHLPVGVPRRRVPG